MADTWLKLGEKIFAFLDTWFKPRNVTFRKLSTKVKLANKIQNLDIEIYKLRNGNKRNNKTIRKIEILEKKKMNLWQKYRGV